jgi:4-amino-4-deoxy-L-arabinose transferase-like glycosyltransferase
MLRTEAFGSRRRSFVVALVAVGLIALVSVFQLVRKLPDDWPYITGWEYEWIAEALARGEGFSFPGDHRWLFDPSDPDDRTDPEAYYATAWEEPIYPFLLAACFRLFGEQGRVVMLVVHLLCFLATVGLVYQLGKRLAGPAVGLVAVAILVLIPRTLLTVSSQLVNSALAGLLVVTCALLVLWCLEHVSIRRSLILGSTLGVSALVHTALLAFVPLAGLLVLASGRPTKLRASQAGLVVVVAAAVVIAPWSVRNYLTFGEFVPVRTGLGFIADLANSSLADTFRREPGANATVEVPWTASGFVEAWATLAHKEKERHEFFAYTIRTAKATSPQGFAELNEAKRDKFHLERALSFILSNPATAMELMLIKVSDFYFLNFASRPRPDRAGLVAMLALIGVLVAYRDRRVQAVALFVLAYSAPYFVTGPFFYRYRYPIEPLMAVLAGIGVVWLAEWVFTHLRRRSAPEAMG